MVTFGKEIGILIRNERDRRVWSALELIGKVYPKAGDGQYPSLLSQLSRLETGASDKPTAKVFRGYCDALGISTKQTEFIRRKYDSKGRLKPEQQAQLEGWPELCTNDFPETLVSFDYRKEELGVTLIEAMSKTHQKTEASFTSYVNGYGLHDASLNLELLKASLSDTKVPIKIGPKFLAYDPTDLSDSQLLSFVKSQKTGGGTKLFNSKKVRLSSSIGVGANAVVYISETDYCSSLLTDQLSFQQIYHDSDPKKWVYNGYSYFYDDKAATLLPLEHANQMSNQLGASTIAFSRDGTLLLVQQTRSNAQSVGLIAPSGSGSLDWEDVGERKDLLSIVATGAARELVEECGLDVKETESDHSIPSALVAEKFLRIFGFSRMVHRGGKPEFYCVSVLPFDALEIQEAKLAKGEKAYTQRKERSQSKLVDFSQPAQVIKDTILEVCGELIGPRHASEIAAHNHVNFLSFPLRHALDLLMETLNSEGSDELVDFLRRAAHEAY